MKAILLALGTAGVMALLALAACSKPDSGQSEMSWARAALERNERIEVVAADAEANTFTVRVKETGELRRVRLDQLVAGPRLPSVAPVSSQASTTSPVGAAMTASPAAAPVTGSASAPGTPVAGAVADNGPTAAPGEPATSAAPAATAAEPPVVAADVSHGAKVPRSEAVSGAAPGRVLASGPGYTIKAADTKGATIRRVSTAGPAATATVEKMHAPIICQGERFLQINNRNLEFDGDALSAEDGCELHITNSRILAKGVGVVVRNANVHIENSDIESDSASVDASDGAQVYSASSTFKGIRRREDNATFHDLGGNAWN